MPGKRICFFNTNKAWGGGEKWAHDFSLLARDNGYAVHAVAHAKGDLAQRLAQAENIRLHLTNAGNLSFLNPLKILELGNFFRDNRIETVIFALPRDLKSGGIAARLAGVPNIIYRRGIALPIRNTALNRFLFGRILTRFLCNSEETRRLALQRNPNLIAPERTSVIYNGFDLDSYDAADATPLRPAREGVVTIGNAARLTTQKGQKLLIDCAAQLKQRGHSFRMLIAGSGELEQELKAHAREKNVTDCVEFLGFVDNMRAFHESVDIFALTSLWEGFGYVLVEAMAAQKPVVAFAVSSNPEVVTDGSTGLLAKVGEVLDMTDKLETLIASPELRRKMGKAGRESVVRRFTLDKAFAALEPLL